MFTLQKLNVVKVVESQLKKDRLLAQGFSLVEKPCAKRGKRRGEGDDGPITDPEDPVRD